jgi:hypothetical protein
MKHEQEEVPASARVFSGYTRIDVSQSDIRPIARAELKRLKGLIQQAISRTADATSRYHLEDCVARIDNILDPK